MYSTRGKSHENNHREFANTDIYIDIRINNGNKEKKNTSIINKNTTVIKVCMCGWVRERERESE